MTDIFDLFKKIEKQSAAATVPFTYIAVGLGNPGKEYANTRHNAGFIAMDRFTRERSVSCDRARFQALTGEITLGGVRVLLMKPQTFMNRSGEAVKEAADFYKIPPERVVVIYDDTSLDVGRLRIRRNGSAGGHNGIKSLIEFLGTDQFPRIKIGVGAKPHPDMILADWVLSTFSREDRETIDRVVAVIPDVLGMLVTGKTEEAMGKFNGFDAARTQINEERT